MNQTNPSTEPNPSHKPQSPLTGVRTIGDVISGLPVLKLKPTPAAETEEEWWRRRRIAELREKCNAPPRHWKRRDLDRSGEWGKLEKAMLGKLGKGGLLAALVGVRGNGKTQIGVEAVRYTTGVLLLPARFVTVTEFLMELKGTWGNDATESELDLMLRYRRLALLVIDEFARRGQTDWEDRVLFELLNKRYGDQKDTLLIANQKRADFLESVGPSIADRMKELGAVIDCTWLSFRKPPGETQ